MKKVEKEVLKYMKERGWTNLKPADIAKSIAIESGELLENFQWDNPTIEELKKDTEKLQLVKKELADIFIYALDMVVLLNLDSEKIIMEKLELIKKKYPVNLVKVKKNDTSDANEMYWKIKKEYRRKGLN